jgi:hypothetical protein
VTFCADAYDAAAGAARSSSARLEQFKQLTWAAALLLARPIAVDGRNIYSPGAMRALGFVYRCLGRPECDESTTVSGEWKTSHIW